MWNWFNGLQLRHFWEPITASNTADWRRTHIVAHVLGGMGWLLIHEAIAVALGAPVSLTSHPLRRVLLVALWQLLVWEWVQVENWRPTLVTPPLPANTGYPWLSAGWDTATALVGAACLELLLCLFL